jgi:hypothetical protein
MFLPLVTESVVDDRASDYAIHPRVENLPDEESRCRAEGSKDPSAFSYRLHTFSMKRRRNIHNQDCHESEYSFMRRVADRLDMPWQAIVSDEKSLAILREAMYAGMNVAETTRFFQEILEEKDIRKKTKVKTPGQRMDISKRSKHFPTPPCDLDSSS